MEIFLRPGHCSLKNLWRRLIGFLGKENKTKQKTKVSEERLPFLIFADLHRLARFLG